MPEEDVSDLRDVVDAINKLCETMKTSNYDDDDVYEDCSRNDAISASDAADVPQYVECTDTELVSPEEVIVRRVEIYSAERWSDSASQISLPGQVEDVETVTSDTEPAMAPCDPFSEMYYTASSEVSLLSDLELPERFQSEEDAVLESRDVREDKKEIVIAGHVAAMRERFESMTRTNTPCPDLIRSLSPSLDVFTNITPSPDHLG